MYYCDVWREGETESDIFKSFRFNDGLLKNLNKTKLFPELGGVSGGEMPKKAAEERVLL